MSEKEVCRYLELADRRLFIVIHSGIDWQPEYGPELEAIDKELAGLREQVDRVHGVILNQPANTKEPA